MMFISEIRIDEEFEKLIPPLSPEEFQQLEENCLAEGIRDPLVIWMTPSGNRILVDGHNRYRIAQKHGLKFSEINKTFAGREEAKTWILRNQIGRRNLLPYVKAQLALRLKPAIEKEAKRQQVRKSVQQNSVKQKPINTQKELATIAGVSHDTIHKVETIEKSGNDFIKEQARKGELSVNAAYTMVTNKPPKQSQKEFVESVKKRHEGFKEQQADGVVSIEDIKKDKDDQDTLAIDAYTVCLSAGKRLDEIATLIEEHDIDLKNMAANISPDQKEILNKALTRWFRTIMRLQKEVNT